MKYDAFGFLPKIYFFIFFSKKFTSSRCRPWNTQRICNTFCRPLNVSAARAQARHAVAPMLFNVLMSVQVSFEFPTSETKFYFYSEHFIKMSTNITVASFFSFFFVKPQNVCVVDTFYRTPKSTEPASGITSELQQRVPLFVYSIFNVRYKTGLDYRVPPLNFFRHCTTFFRIIVCRQTVPLKFLIFCSKLKFQKAQRVPPY